MSCTVCSALYGTLVQAARRQNHNTYLEAWREGIKNGHDFPQQPQLSWVSWLPVAAELKWKGSDCWQEVSKKTYLQELVACQANIWNAACALLIKLYLIRLHPQHMNPQAALVLSLYSMPGLDTCQIAMLVLQSHTWSAPHLPFNLEGGSWPPNLRCRARFS